MQHMTWIELIDIFSRDHIDFLIPISVKRAQFPERLTLLVREREVFLYKSDAIIYFHRRTGTIISPKATHA